MSNFIIVNKKIWEPTTLEFDDDNNLTDISFNPTLKTLNIPSTLDVSNNVQFNSNFDVSGNVTFDSKLDVSSIDISNNVLIMNNLDVSYNTLVRNQLDVSGVDISTCLVIPVNNTSTRVAKIGSIRYNNQLLQFEGCDNLLNWGSLGGVMDVDQDTYISAENNPTDDNDELRFFTLNTERVRIRNNGKMDIFNDISLLDISNNVRINDGTLNVESGNTTLGGTLAVSNNVTFKSKLEVSGDNLTTTPSGHTGYDAGDYLMTVDGPVNVTHGIVVGDWTGAVGYISFHHFSGDIITIQPSSASSGGDSVYTLPAGNGNNDNTLISNNSTDILTNKTLRNTDLSGTFTGTLVEFEFENLTFNSNLDVSGVDISNNLIVQNKLDVSGVDISNNLIVRNNLDVYRTLDVSNNVTFKSKFEVSGDHLSYTPPGATAGQSGDYLMTVDGALGVTHGIVVGDWNGGEEGYIKFFNVYGDIYTIESNKIFANTSDKITLGGGAVDVGASGSTTTVKGALNVDEAVTLDTTLGVTGVTTLGDIVVNDGDITRGTTGKAVNIVSTLLSSYTDKNTIPANSNAATSASTPSLWLGKRTSTTGNDYWGLSLGTVWSGGASYIQSMTIDNQYPLLLNPKGGNVGIGKESAGFTLDISGTLNVTGQTTVTGNLGLGTTTPDEKLEVIGNIRLRTPESSSDVSSAANIYLDCNNESSGTPNGMVWKTDYGGYSSESAAVRFMPEANAFRGGIGIFTNSVDTTSAIATQKMWITGSGNVGIGKSPGSTYKLDVGGAVNIDSTLNVTGQTTLGLATATTPATTDDNTNVATTAYVTTAIDNLVANAPGALNTLNELAAALGDNANYAATITTALALKAPLASPTLSGLKLSDNTIKNNNGGAWISTDVTTTTIHDDLNLWGYSFKTMYDNRIFVPNEIGAAKWAVGFGCWDNNNAGPYADMVALNTYGDSSGGNTNLIMFKKSAIGMRIYQASFGSTSNFSTYKDVLLSGDDATVGDLTVNGTVIIDDIIKSNNTGPRISLAHASHGYLYKASTAIVYWTTGTFAPNQTYNHADSTSLGTTSYRWSTIWGNNLNLVGDITLGSAIISSSGDNIHFSTGKVGIGHTSDGNVLSIKGAFNITPISGNPKVYRSGSTIWFEGNGDWFYLYSGLRTTDDIMPEQDTLPGTSPTLSLGRHSYRWLRSNIVNMYTDNIYGGSDQNGGNLSLTATNFIVTATLQLNNNKITSSSGDSILESSGKNIVLRGNVSIGNSWQSSSYPLICNEDNGTSVQGYFKGSKYNLLLDSNSSTGYNLACMYGSTYNFIVKSNGRVGIGTDSPGDYKLDVNGSLNCTSLNVNGSPFSGGGSEWTPSGSNIYFTNGYVGIGTVSPSARCSVNGDIQVSKKIILSYAAVDAWWTPTGTENTNYGYPGAIYMSKVKSGGAYPFLDHGNLIIQPRIGMDIVFGTGSTLGTRMVIKNSGNVGIGMSSPSYKLHVDGISNCETNMTYKMYLLTKKHNTFDYDTGEVANHSTYRGDIKIENEGTESWYMRLGGYLYGYQSSWVGTHGGYPTLYANYANLYLACDGGYSYVNSSGVVDFTGQHKCEEDYDNNENIVKNIQQYIGLIAIASGKISSAIRNTDISGNIFIRHYNKSGITINNSLPMFTISSTYKDKRALGIISDGEDDEFYTRNTSHTLKKTERKTTFNGFTTVINVAEDDRRAYINSLGEGAIWVCNEMGNIENGDYITSSNLKGYGCKQDDDILHNYTVAKATIDCDFTDEELYEMRVIDDKKCAFISCTYHCG